MFAKFSKKQDILYIDKHHVCVDLEQIPGLAYFISGSELIKVPRKKTTPVQQFGYGSIPINTIFNGMNIHLPAILMWTTGVQGFDTLPFIQKSRSIWLLILGVKTNWISMKFLWRSFSWCSRTMQLDANTNIRSLFEAKLSTKRGNKSITRRYDAEQMGRCGTWCGVSPLCGIPWQRKFTTFLVVGNPLFPLELHICWLPCSIFCSIHVLSKENKPFNSSKMIGYIYIYVYTYISHFIHPIDGLKHLYNHGFFIDGIIYIYLYVDIYIYIYDVYPCISHILWIHDVYPIYYGLYFILFRIHPLIYPLTYPPIYWDIVDIRVMHMPQTLWLFNIAMETDP